MLSAQTEFNTILPIAYTHGFAGKDQWDDLRASCCQNQSTMSCDFYNSPDPTCQNKARAAVSGWIDNAVFSYDMYQDCYRNIYRLERVALAMGLEVSSFLWKDQACLQRRACLSQQYIKFEKSGFC
ncbi:hypothetical protein COOONC_14873 [Cooperia oncophora]